MNIFGFCSIGDCTDVGNFDDSIAWVFGFSNLSIDFARDFQLTFWEYTVIGTNEDFNEYFLAELK